MMSHMVCLVMVVLVVPAILGARTPLIIDHTCTDLASIPLDVIEQIKSPDNIFHYGHRSHGSQPVDGLFEIESTYGETYNFDSGYCSLPSDTTALGMWDGMLYDDYVSPEAYWFSEAGMDELRSILNDNPQIRYSMWSWCGEHHYWPLEDVQAYLDSLDQLGTEFPNVTFVYMTGNAEYDHDYPDPYGIHARWVRGNMIRDYCLAHDKVLFDFEDMDCWHEGSQHTVTVELDSTCVIPCQHPAYWGDEVAHTTMVNCVNKGKAFWHMMVALEGLGTEPVTRNTMTLEVMNNASSSPSLRYSIPHGPHGALAFYSVDGRRLERHFLDPLHSSFLWTAVNRPSGSYIARLSVGNSLLTARVVLIR